MKCVVVFALVLSGCGTITLTAGESLTPVMLGPVHYVGPDQGKLAHGIDRRNFSAEYGIAGGSGADFYAGQLDMTIARGMDLALADMAPDYMLGIKAIDCRLYHVSALVVNVVTNACRLDTQQLLAKVPGS